MKSTNSYRIGIGAILLAFFALFISSCTPYMKMNPPADSDKPLPVPSGDNSCWLHAASNMLAGAGYGTGTTLQARADDIWADMNANYGTVNGGWTNTALQWWLGSANNTWTTNPYSVVTVYGNTTRIPWANTNGAMDVGNELRTCNMVGLSISWPSGAGGTGGHAITAWGDNIRSSSTITTNPGGVRVTDSDTDTGGDVQAYVYDPYTNPNPGGPNVGNGWYFNYGATHPFIKHIVTLSRTTTGFGVNSVRVLGSFQIKQTSEIPATDLHYRVGTDVDILTYRTWLDWVAPPPVITESQPRRELTVNWDFTKNQVPRNTLITINTEFIEPSWNYISYRDVNFTYPKERSVRLPDLAWRIKTPGIEKAEAIPNVTGGYVIGSFDVYDLNNPGEPVIRYRLVHQYLYNESPEFHTFFLEGMAGYEVRNLRFTHSYGYPSVEELWRTEKWMMQLKETFKLSEKPVEITIDWKGQLPYPEGDRAPMDNSVKLK